MTDRSIVTVSQLNRYVKALLSENPVLSGLMVRGEISNFVRHYKSGHLYFTLKDETASVKAVMFRSNAECLRFQPENGMTVITSGSASLYERDGSYQLYVTDMQPDGIGALYLAYEQLKARLEKEGLFDASRKRTLPAYPGTVGIVTSEGAAALQDMLHILGRRFPLAKVVLCPAQVQGTGAAQTLIDGIGTLNARRACDVIIIGRGGGSMEDLWAFNDEKLAREIAASAIPVISAVGHETDFTIADFAADVRAPTPSAAAELAVPNMDDLRLYLDGLMQQCSGSMHRRLLQSARRLEAARGRLKTPKGVLDGYVQRLSWMESRINGAMDRRLRAGRERLIWLDSRIKGSVQRRLEAGYTRLRHASALVDAASPVKLLERGYSLTRVDGRAVTSVSQVEQGHTIKTRVADGEIASTVTGTGPVPERKGGPGWQSK